MQPRVRGGLIREPQDFMSADDLVLLVSLDMDLQHAQGQLSAKCDVARMRISSSMSDIMMLHLGKRQHAVSRNFSYKTLTLI